MKLQYGLNTQVWEYGSINESHENAHENEFADFITKAIKKESWRFC